MKISSILSLDLTQGNYSYMRTKERQEKNNLGSMPALHFLQMSLLIY